MKYLIVDESSKIALTFSQDVRISTNLKRSVFDTEIITVYPHHDYYQNITDRIIFENHIIVEDGKELKIALEKDEPSYIKSKKLISVKKRKLLYVLFKILERTVSSYSYFINESIVNILNNEKMKDFYYKSREFNKETSLKDLEVRQSTHMMTMIKLQACVDDFIDMIILTNDIQELDNLEQKIRNRMI